MKPKVLTIAGSDSSGGAGIQADLKTFVNFDVHGLTAITAITAQSSKGVAASWPVKGEAVYKQIMNLYEDMEINAVKIGMLSDLSIVRAVVKALTVILADSKVNIPVVLDPVFISSSGFRLLEPDALDYLVDKLVPLSTVITPNLAEAEFLTELTLHNIDSIKEAALKIQEMGAATVILKGGHREGEKAEDILYDGTDYISFSTNRIGNKEVHGTGCVFSSALAANLALGKTLSESVYETKRYITEGINLAAPISRDPEAQVFYLSNGRRMINLAPLPGSDSTCMEPL